MAGNLSDSSSAANTNSSPNIVDFICLEERLIIELDGGQHNDPGNTIADQRRTEALRQLGFRVLRFWNHEIFQDGEAVQDVIYNALCGKRP